MSDLLSSECWAHWFEDTPHLLSAVHASHPVVRKSVPFRRSAYFKCCTLSTTLGDRAGNRMYHTCQLYHAGSHM